MEKTVIIGAVALVGLVVGFVALSQVVPESRIVQIVQESVSKFGGGAGASAESTSDFQCYNGVCSHYRKGTWVQFDNAGASGSTTPFAVRSPLNATSTLIDAFCEVPTATGTAAALTIVKSNSPFSTSTNGTIMEYTIPASSKNWFTIGTTTPTGSGAADTSIATAVASSTFSPGQYLVIGAKGGTGPATTQGFQFPSARCVAEFRTVN